MLIAKPKISPDIEQDHDPPWKIRKIHLHYKVGKKTLTEKSVERAFRLSEEKYYSVAATNWTTAEITTNFEILENAGHKPVESAHN